MANSPDEMAATLTPPADGNWLFARLPDGVLGSLTAEQRNALEEAVVGNHGRRPPVNIRFSLPLLKWRFYMSVIGGEEKRNAARRARDRVHHPLQTAGNLFFVFGLAVLFYMAAALVVALQSSIIEF